MATNLSDEILVSIDKIRLEQVFSNPVGNAAKYSNKNTKINVSCSVDEPGKARISVSDEGIGMSALTM